MNTQIPASEQRALRQIEVIVGEKEQEKDLLNIEYWRKQKGFLYQKLNGHVTGIILRYTEKKIGQKNIKLLQAFPKLKVLHIVRQDIQNISPIRKLNDLLEICLSENQIQDISPLQDLNNLMDLTLDNNYIQDITPVKNLCNLISLNLNRNEIHDITPIQKLNKISHLYIAYNQIQDISPIQNFINLKFLTLAYNQIQEFPKTLFEAPISLVPTIDTYKTEGLGWKSNPIKSPPPEILKQGREAVLDYFESLENKDARPLNEVKVILVGDGAAGKTSISKALRGLAFDQKEPQTNGINISPWSITLGNEKVNTYLWDFGGQEIMHATHQFFLSKRSLYLLVLDSRKDEAPEYWLDHIKAFGGDSPIIIVMNKYDINPGYSLNEKELKQSYSNIKSFLKVSCKESTNLTNLKGLIQQEVDQIDIRTQPFAQSWFNVKERLQQMKGDYINYEAYEEICEDEGIMDTAQDTLLEFLNDLGISLKYKHDSGILVFSPNWLTNAVYSIITSKLVAKQNGIFKREALPTIFKSRKKDNFTFTRDKYPFILGILKNYELAYERENGEWLVPSQIPKNPPAYNFTDPNIQFYFDYPFLPPSIFPRLFISLKDNIDGDVFWRNGLLLHWQELGTQALVTVNEYEKQIRLQVEGKEPRTVLSYLRLKLRDINKSFDKLEVEEMVPIPDYPSTYIEYSELLDAEAMGDREIKVPGKRAKVNVAVLLNGIESVKEREAYQKGDVKVYTQIVNAPVNSQTLENNPIFENKQQNTNKD